MPLFAYELRPLGICFTAFGITDSLGALLRLHRRSAIMKRMQGQFAGGRVLVRFRQAGLEMQGQSTVMRACWSMVAPIGNGLRIRSVPRAVVFVPKESELPI